MKKLLLTLILGIMLIALVTAGGIIISQSMSVDKDVADSLKSEGVSDYKQSNINCNENICDITLTVGDYKTTLATVNTKNQEEIKENLDLLIQQNLEWYASSIDNKKKTVKTDTKIVRESIVSIVAKVQKVKEVPKEEPIEEIVVR